MGEIPRVSKSRDTRSERQPQISQNQRHKTQSIRFTTMAQIGLLEVWLGFQAALSFTDESSVILRKRSGGIPYTAMNLLVK